MSANGNAAAAAATLMDFSKPVDVPLLERIVETASGPTEMRSEAERVLLQYQEHPQAWQQVDAILSTAQNQATKFFALQVRTPVACEETRWVGAHGT